MVDDDKPPQTVTFSASLPPIQSAIQMDGLGDGARIKLDIPARDMGAVLLLQHFGTGKPLKVIVEFVSDEQPARVVSRSTAKRRV